VSQHFTTTAAVLILVAASTQAQTPAVVAERVRTAILAKESGWRLQDSALEDWRFWHEWRHRSERLSIEYTEYLSHSEASAWLRALPGSVPMPGYEPVSGVGDEALIWARLGSSKTTTIYFRKTRYIGSVSAPSTASATRIAKLVAAQIHE
jgi:hypothetical protein